MLALRDLWWIAAVVAAFSASTGYAVPPGEPDLQQLASVESTGVRTTPLTLERALELALQNHPALKTARGSFHVARARVTGSRAAWLPQIAVQIARTNIDEVTHVPPSARSPGGTLDHSSDTKRASLTVRQLVTDFGRTGNRIDASERTREGARRDFENTIQDVVLGVEEAYFNLVAARHLAETNRQALERAQQHVDLARGFVEVGSRPKFDLTRAQVDLSNSKVALLQANNQLELARVTLANALGFETAAPGEPVDRPASQAPILTAEKALETGLATRRDLQALRARLDAARATVLAAQAGYRPTLNVAASKSLHGEDYPLDRETSVTLSLDWNVFDGASTRAAVAEARANVESLGGQYDTLRQKAVADIRQNHLNVRETQSRIEATGEALRQAAENLDLARGRYTSGVGSAIEVTDAELALTTAQTAKIRAELDFEIALARLQRSMGLIGTDVSP